MLVLIYPYQSSRRCVEEFGLFDNDMRQMMGKGTFLRLASNLRSLRRPHLHGILQVSVSVQRVTGVDLNIRTIRDNTSDVCLQLGA